MPCSGWSTLHGVNLNWKRNIALLVISGSIKKLFLIDFLNTYLFSIFFFNSFCQYLDFLNIFFKKIYSVKKCGVTQHCVNWDWLTLIDWTFQISFMLTFHYAHTWYLVMTQHLFYFIILDIVSFNVILLIVLTVIK